METKPFEVKVVPVRVAPTLSIPHIQSGIQNKDSALRWGRLNMHPTVYYYAAALQRVYAERCICDMAGDNAACRVHHPAGRS